MPKSTNGPGTVDPVDERDGPGRGEGDGDKPENKSPFPAPLTAMIPNYGLIGNGSVIARVRVNGTLDEGFYPSVGFQRHILQSRFALRNRITGQHCWVDDPSFAIQQEYVDRTNVLRTTFTRSDVRLVLTDFVGIERSVIIRQLEIENLTDSPLELDLIHAEAASVADHRGQFHNNTAYYCRLHESMVRYRGYPWDSGVESNLTWLITGHPVPDAVQAGLAYRREGQDYDAFVDWEDGELHGNRYAADDKVGATSAFLWRRTLAVGDTVRITVSLTPGSSLCDAEDTLEELRERSPEQWLGEAMTYWRSWIDPARRSVPDVGDDRLHRLYLRSLLLLKLLQDRRYGSIVAAPNLDPPYRFCWPRDAVFEAWSLDRCGYHKEARKIYRWLQRYQSIEGLWYQNYYLDGRRHWGGIQVDQGATVVWGIWEHFRMSGSREFLVKAWPTLKRAIDYVLSRRNPETGLVFSEQDLWEETSGHFTYTNAAAVAGLRAGAQAAAEMGADREAREWFAEADKLWDACRTHLRRDGIWSADGNPFRHFYMRDDYHLDTSTLGLNVPFGVIPPGDPELLATAEALEESMPYPIGGLGRYVSDQFQGGNPWSLTSLWAAIYYARSGRGNDAYRLLNWCLDRAGAHDFLPEQSHEETGEPYNAVPLGWSHAWFLVLMHDLAALKVARETGT